MNIESMPNTDVQLLHAGLEEMVNSPQEDEGKRSKHNFYFSRNTNSKFKKTSKNSSSKKKSNSISINDYQEKLSSANKQIVLEKFKELIPKPEISKKLNSLSDLLGNYKNCQRCPLGKTRSKLVFGNGSMNSKVIFLGEGPGADEDAQGKPFVGRSGRLLTKMINSIGIERDDVYITNIVKCRPPGNRNPTPAEISCCLPIIKQQLEILNPRLIVTLGNISTKSLIPNLPGITKVHGRFMQYENWTVMPTFHPSYLLRNRSSMILAWEDFKKIPKLAFLL